MINPLDLVSFATGLSSQTRPFFVHFECTYRCNMRCGFCNIWRSNPYPFEAPTVTFIDRLTECWDIGCRLVSFTGGEPLLRNDIGELVKHSKNLGFYTGLVTNGFFLHKHLANLRGLDYLAVSFSYNEAAFNTSKGAKTFRQVKSNILNAQTAGLNPHLFCTIDYLTYPHLEETVEFSEKHGLEMHVNPVSEIPREKVNEVEWNEIGASNLMVNIKKLYPKVKFSSFFLSRKNGYTINDYVGRCQAARTTVALKPDGTISLPCLLQTVANSGATPLREFWKSDEAKRIRESCGRYRFCEKCNVICMYEASLIGHPMQIFRWLSDM